MKTIKSVRKRPKSRYTNQPKKNLGVIYLNEKWVGKKVKIIEIK